MKAWIKSLAARFGLLVQGWAILQETDLSWLEQSQGTDGVLRLLQASSGSSAVRILRNKGAIVGHDVRIRPGMVLENVDKDLTNLTIGDGTHIGAQVLMDLAQEIAIGARATISMRCIILTHMAVGDSKSDVARNSVCKASVVLEDDVYLGAGVTVLPGVRLGQGCLVGAGAVVTKDVMPEQVVAGVPARPVR